MVSHGKSAFKLERMKHIRSTHEQFPCLMAAPDESIVHRAVIHQCRRKTSRNKSSTLIYQPCSVSPPVNCQLFLRPILGIICHEQSVHVEHVLQVADGVEQRIALLFSMVYCLEPTKRYWDTVCLKTLSPGVASRILVRQATATALLSRRNATCGFSIAETPDWEIQQQVATTRVTRVPGPASATCTVVVCLQLNHLSWLNFTCLPLGVKDEFRYRTQAAFDILASMCLVVPQKPIYPSWESPVRKAPCCNGFKCTSNSNKHRKSKPFLPSGTEDEDPTTSTYWFWPFDFAPPKKTAVGKSW